jgi:Mg2+-importing ATPase
MTSTLSTPGFDQPRLSEKGLSSEEARRRLALSATTLLIVLIGITLPFTPLAAWLGFTPLPAGFFLFLIAATGTYLLLVEMFKRRLMERRLG